MATINITTGCFGNLDSKQVRFLHEISQFGYTHLLLFDDKLYRSLTGISPKFPLSERKYFLESVRYVDKIHVITALSQLEQVATITGVEVKSWYIMETENTPACEDYAKKQGIKYYCITDDQLPGFPGPGPIQPSKRKKVIITGCFDWFHSGHVRFLEEASKYGDIYAVVGHDKNIESLKGPGHPMFPQEERRFMVGAIRFVKQALISSGNGWLDAEPEILLLKPDIYLVNEDGNKGEKEKYCRENRIEYIVLKRNPKPGLNARTSTQLRGF